MPEIEPRLDRIESHIERLVGVTAEVAREVRSLVQGLASDRVAFRETLRDLSGFVATAGLEMNQLTRQIQQLAEITATGFASVQTTLSEINRQMAENNRQMAENNRQMGENNRQMAENNRQMAENNRHIEENNQVIRRLLDILARGRGNGEGPPREPA
jgi:chromosome segregation ATPase